MNKITSMLVAVIAAGVIGMPVSNTYAASPDSPANLLAKVDALNNQVEQANGRLDAANRKLAADQKLEASLNLQIAALARLQYKRPVLVVQFFEAGSVSQVLADITSNFHPSLSASSSNSGASSTITCAFVPPIPNALTPALLGQSLTFHSLSSLFT